MRIDQVRVFNFRNITEAEFKFHPSVNIFVGENAQGKTNLLESIYLLTRGKSFRTRDMSVLLKNNSQDYFSLTAQLQKSQLNHDVQFSYLNQRRSVKVNGKKTSAAAISKEFSSVLFSPESLAVIKDSDKERRDLIDELILSVYVEKAVYVEDYKKLLKQRNKLLRDLADGTIESDAKNKLYLESLTQKFLEVATELTITRIEAIKRLLPSLEESLCYILDSKNVDIAVDYVVSGHSLLDYDREHIYNAMYKRWLELSRAETQCGYSLVGPHKHDICVLLDGNDSRYYCSQGQQRLLILAFKMAQIGLHFSVHSIYPILLLDDVLSELDEKKKVRLVEYLNSIDAQIFITTAERSVLDYLDVKRMTVYEVKNGEFNYSLCTNDMELE